MDAEALATCSLLAANQVLEEENRALRTMAGLAARVAEANVANKNPALYIHAIVGHYVNGTAAWPKEDRS